MPHQEVQDTVTNLQGLKAVFDLLIPEEVNEFQRHGNATISGRLLAAVAITCWGWTSDSTLDERIKSSWAVVQRAFNVRTSATRQGVMKALATCGSELVEAFTTQIASKIPQVERRWTQNGKVNLVVDGTKFAAPRTTANQECYAANSRRTKKKYNSKSSQSKAQTVQVLVTVLWHLGTGLPFRWHVNESTGSERVNLKSMLETLPDNVRFIGDAEYVGYSLWSAIIQAKKSFLFRVGSNVTLLKNLGHLRSRDGYLYYWPESSMRRSQPPIILRLFKLNTGKKSIYLVTNDLDMTVEQANDLFRQRWTVEVFFRTVKQSCKKAKLCCGTPTNVLTEMNWTLIGIWAALYTGRQVMKANGCDSNRMSPIKVVRAFQFAVAAVCFSSTRGAPLSELLIIATRPDESSRTTSKKSRNYPRKRKKPRAGKPKIKTPSKEQKQRWLEFAN